MVPLEVLQVTRIYGDHRKIAENILGLLFNFLVRESKDSLLLTGWQKKILNKKTKKMKL